MKKLFACIMAAFVCLASCAFAFVTPASAAEDDMHVKGWFRYVGNYSTITGQELGFGVIYAFGGVVENHFPSDVTECLSSYVAGTSIVCDPTFSSRLFLAGFTGFCPSNWAVSPLTDGHYVLELFQVCYVDIELHDGTASSFFACFEPCNPFAGLAEYLPSNPATPTPTPTNGGIYGSIYELITEAFYGENATLSGDQQLVATVLATAAIVFMFALPFLIVWLLIRSIGAWR